MTEPTNPGTAKLTLGNRRRFLQSTLAGAAAAAVGLPAFQARGAADRVTVGIIGCQRGRTLFKDSAGQNLTVACVCDPDEARMKRLQKEAKAPQAVADMRRIFDDRAIDVVWVAAPDHWHAAAAIRAAEAGKHVYVEKPCSHNIREGRLMIEAARRTKRVMQVGSQTRGTAVFQHAVQLLREGAVGTILAGKAWTCQKRVNIGHQQPSAPPPGFDYDQWVGPAPMCPFQSNRHHYTWHWWYDFGTGDAGNRGVHEMDVALWGMNITTHPTQVIGYNEKLYFDDDQQFPDTQYVTFEFAAPGTPHGKQILTYEQRIWSPSLQDKLGDANAFYGTDGYMILSKHTGWQLFDPKGRLLKEEQGLYSVTEHMADFLDAIRNDRRPVADIEIGHRSATLAHLANILAKSGRATLKFDPQTEHVVNDPQADALTQRTYRAGHWAAL